MAGTMRRRRGTAAVSPVGVLGSERAGVYCLTQANGYEVWYGRAGDGCILRTHTVAPGDDAWPTIADLLVLVYGTDDVESWARRTIVGSVLCLSPEPALPLALGLSGSVLPVRARTSADVRPTLALMR